MQQLAPWEPYILCALLIANTSCVLCSGVKAGQNTLNALCTRVVTRGVAEGRGYDVQRFLNDYVSFMTTPGSHDDTYAESFHRDFFKNWAAGGALLARGLGLSLGLSLGFILSQRRHATLRTYLYLYNVKPVSAIHLAFPAVGCF